MGKDTCSCFISIDGADCLGDVKMNKKGGWKLRAAMFVLVLIGIYYLGTWLWGLL